jgi:hypothetical protein
MTFNYKKAIATIKKKEEDKKQFRITLKEEERRNKIALFSSSLNAEKQRMQGALIAEKTSYNTVEEERKTFANRDKCGVLFEIEIGVDVKAILNKLKEEEPDIAEFVFITRYKYWQEDGDGGRYGYIEVGIVNAFEFNWSLLTEKDNNNRFYKYAVVFSYDFSD